MDTADGRESADALWSSFASHLREPTDEEWESLPDLKSQIACAEPEDSVLCVQWEIGDGDPNDALSLRNAVTEKVEAALDRAGLLVDWEGASIGMGTVETSFSVTDFRAAKTVVWDSLSDSEKINGCRIFDETAGI